MADNEFDVIVVGAGFSGLCSLYKLRQKGFKVRLIEAAPSVGGVWFWNRYPGAACDVESIEYNLNLSDDLTREWTWTRRYADRDELMRYMNFVVEKLALAPDIQLNTRVEAMNFDDGEARWTLKTSTGESFTAKSCIMATGCLSASVLPRIEGRESFKGDWYHTADWPLEGVDLTGKRVGLIGTGSSGVQSIPIIAEQASQLYVFQRTPAYVLPARNRSLSDQEIEEAKRDYRQKRARAYESYGGTVAEFNERPASMMTAEEREAEVSNRYDQGGFSYLMSFADLLTNKDSNEIAAEFVRNKMRSLVNDPETAESLMPKDYPIGTKRLCLDTNYLETYNRPNVKLVDLRKTPIVQIDDAGIVCSNDRYDVDVIVFATGFDALTGPLLRIDIRGTDGVSLRDEWQAGPLTYLGTCVAGFPNMFIIAGPGSPSVLTNVPVAVEQQTDWVIKTLEYMRANGVKSVDAQPDAVAEWMAHVHDVAHHTLFPEGNSWYMGANIEGKTRVFMLYAGGLAPFSQRCEAASADGYRGFNLVTA